MTVRNMIPIVYDSNNEKYLMKYNYGKTIERITAGSLIDL